MQNRLSSRRRQQAPAKPMAARQGNTLVEQGETTAPKKVARLPHERDESADSQPAAEASGQRMGERAHRDLAQGMVDTGKRPEMDAAYEKMKK